MSVGGYHVSKAIMVALESSPYIEGSLLRFESLSLQPIVAQREPMFLNTINMMLETNPFSILTEFDKWYAWTLRLIKMKATVLEWERTTNP